MTAEEMIAKLDLKPLPEEGGFYRETYRAAVNATCVEFGASKQKPYSTQSTTL